MILAIALGIGGAVAAGVTTYLVTRPNKLSITTSSLPTAVTGQSYSTTLSATGGKGTYTWSATNLPKGLVLTGNTIHGALLSAGKTQVTLEVTAMQQTATITLTLTGTAPIKFDTTTLPPYQGGVAYSQQIVVEGGVGPFTFTLDSTTPLPAGLTLSPSGLISGTPTVGGTFSLKITVKDSSN